jgi:hypothetical protein
MSSSTRSRSSQRLAIVDWTARIGAVTAEALALREGHTVASARARLLACERAGLLTRKRPLADYPAIFTASRAGLSAAGLTGIEPGRVSAANARHSIVCAEVAAALGHAYPDQEIMGERELRREEGLRAKPLASASLGFGGDGAPLLHRPDLVLWPSTMAGPLPVAVEVELTVKAPRRLAAICTAWARCRDVAGVLYFATAEVRGPLARAIGAAEAEGMIVQLALESLTQPLSGAEPTGRERTITEPA